MIHPVPKQKRIRNRALLKQMRTEIPYCERCGKPGYGGVHHIKPRSQGGDDIRENLVRLCQDCHIFGIHAGKYDRRELIEIVAKREGMTPEKVAERIGVVL